MDRQSSTTALTIVGQSGCGTVEVVAVVGATVVVGARVVVVGGGVVAVAALELTLPGPRPDAALASLRALLPERSNASGDAGAAR